MIKKILKKEKGFTLIELLAVIVILGIIAAIAVPSINGIIEKSRNNAIQADAQVVLNAAKLYVAENAPTDDTFTLAKTDAAGQYSIANLLDLGSDVNYSVAVDYTAPTGSTPATYTYTDITVTKDGRTREFATEDALDKNNASE